MEELCNQTSLSTFLWRTYGAQQQHPLRPLWTLGHLASEFAALMAQVGAARGMWWVLARGTSAMSRCQPVPAEPAAWLCHLLLQLH